MRLSFTKQSLKYFVTSNGILDLFRKYYFSHNSMHIALANGNTNFVDSKFYCADITPFKPFQKTCDRLLNNRRSKSKGLRAKINYMLSKGECTFVTLTWNDSLNHLNDKTRRDYVTRCLNKFPLYVANIDFGQDDNFTHREHYHGIILGDWSNSYWNYGFSFGEVIKVSNTKALSKYINKLVSHAFKEGASSTRLLASQHFFTKLI